MRNYSKAYLAILISLCVPILAHGQIDDRFVSTLTDPEIFSASCDEVGYQNIYQNSTAILLDDFENNTSSPLYLWGYQVRTTGNYLLYNNTTA